MNNISEEEIRNLELDEKKNPEFVSENLISGAVRVAYFSHF